MTSDPSQPPHDEAIRTEEVAKEKRDGEEAEDDGDGHGAATLVSNGDGESSGGQEAKGARRARKKGTCENVCHVCPPSPLIC